MHFNIARSPLQNKAYRIRLKTAVTATHFAMVVASIAFIGCSANQQLVASPTTPGPAITITEQDHGKSIELPKGQTLVIRQASNPTTGYQWMLQGSSAPLELMKSDFSRDAHGEKMVGVGGAQVFQFAAKTAGNTVLKLEYRRPWEKEAPAAKRFTVTVVAK
jgi:inhibitor of cysteine peptidase